MKNPLGNNNNNNTDEEHAGKLGKEFILELEEILREEQSQERVLFLSVILQALLDATKKPSEGEAEEEKIARQTAQAWFFASVGVTSQDFVDVCDLAGVDSSHLKTFAFKILKSGEVKFIRRRINTVLSFK